MKVFVLSDGTRGDVQPLRMAATAHHGAAGTIVTATAAGRPQVVCPVTMDRVFWASTEKGTASAVAILERVQAKHDERGGYDG